jgi:hypothetical protein
MSRDIFILGGKRTPMGEYVGALKIFRQSTWARLPRAPHWIRRALLLRKSITQSWATRCKPQVTRSMARGTLRLLVSESEFDELWFVDELHLKEPRQTEVCRDL